ncbi:MAG: hypothetical protein U0930_16505 [Pirellulales bacterium]
MFPLIPVACLAGMIAGALGLGWYESLSSSEQEEADRLATKFAKEMFSKSVANLTRYEMQVVNDAIQQRMSA